MSPKQITVKYPDFPLTLRNLRVGLAGREGEPFTQDELAKKVKVTRSHIANVEGGFMPASPQLLWRISLALKVDVKIVRRAYDASRAKVVSSPKSSKRKTTK